MQSNQQINKNFITYMSNLRSTTGGTSLITFHIPGGYPISLITKKIEKEMSTSSNIKDKNVSKAVTTGLKSANQLIKTSKLNMAPPNGIVICAGETRQCF